MYKINNMILLYSTGNYIPYLVIIYNGRESGKEYMHISIYSFISLLDSIYIYGYICTHTYSFCVSMPETNTTL